MLAALLGTPLCAAQAGDITPLDAAWREAVILAGVTEVSGPEAPDASSASETIEASLIEPLQRPGR